MPSPQRPHVIKVGRQLFSIRADGALYDLARVDIDHTDVPAITSDDAQVVSVHPNLAEPLEPLVILTELLALIDRLAHNETEHAELLLNVLRDNDQLVAWLTAA